MHPQLKAMIYSPAPRSAGKNLYYDSRNGKQTLRSNSKNKGNPYKFK